MVKVPEYQRTETLRPAFRQDVTARATPQAFGSEIGRSMQQAGAAVGQVADAAAAVQDFDATNKAKASSNSLAGALAEAMRGEGGYMTMNGQNAVDGLDGFKKRVEELKRLHGADLTPLAGRKYLAAADAQVQSAVEQALGYQAQQRKVSFVETSEATVAARRNDALNSFTNPEVVTKNIAAGLMEFDERGKMMGWSPKQLSAEKEKFTSRTHADVALRIADSVEAGGALAADKYINDHKDAFKDADILKATRDAIEQPLIAAKADRNANAIVAGLPPSAFQAGPVEKVGGVAGTELFRQSVGGLMGLNENSAPGAISDFIKRSAGIDIDPRVTPWCAGFVNAVLGAQGVKGTGSLAARSFLQFGMKTDSPKPGDIVVLSRGSNAAQGHVGFFQGFDANGNIMVLGGNQGRSGDVSVGTFPKSQLLGFRTAGNVDEATSKMPNYNPATLAAMYEKANAIRDPKEREATFTAIDRFYTRQKRALDTTRQQAVDDLEKRVIADPSFDPSKLPVSVQQVIGMSGMNALRGYRDARIADGKVKTDVVVMDTLLSEAVIDPEAFSKRDLLPYRGKLSDSDYLALRGKQRGAIADLSKEIREGSVYKDAFSIAGDFYSAAGIKTGSSAAALSDKNKAAKAEFNGAMRNEVDEFIQKEKRKPTYDEMRTIASALTLKVVGSEKRGAWSPARLFDDDQDDVWEGRAFQRGTAPAGVNRRVVPSYADVPPEWVGPIKSSLTKKLGRAPTNTEIATEWGGIAMDMIGSN